MSVRTHLDYFVRQVTTVCEDWLTYLAYDEFDKSWFKYAPDPDLDSVIDRAIITKWAPPTSYVSSIMDAVR